LWERESFAHKLSALNDLSLFFATCATNGAIFSPWLVAQTNKLRAMPTPCVTHQLFHKTGSFLKHLRDNLKL